MPIFYDQSLRIFAIQNPRSSYIFGINGAGGLQHLYWGAPVQAADCAPLLEPRLHSSFDPAVERESEEVSGWGASFYSEPTLKAGGEEVRDLRLVYATHTIEHDDVARSWVLCVVMNDELAGVELSAVYRVWDGREIIARHCEIQAKTPTGDSNPGRAALTLESAQSAAWIVPASRGSRLTHVRGRWIGEFQLGTTTIAAGKMLFESRRGFTSPGANPWFALDGGGATESTGEVWYGALAWSGNWKISLEHGLFDTVRIVGGPNDFDFSWTLKTGESFVTPVFYGGYSSEGFGAMSRELHGLQNAVLLRPARRKVVYNSWEATYFDVRAKEQMELADIAAELGVEVFVIDDGWFGARNNDKAGLGDWFTNPDKFPEGLDPLIAKVNGLGMDFGIWVEPEMVNPDSDLYRGHPDWVYHFPGRPQVLSRNQLVLNMAMPEVKSYILEALVTLLSRHNIAFVKWDFNRAIAEPGWPGMAAESQKEIWVRHVQAVYGILAELRGRFPSVSFESCAGGGGRVDMGIQVLSDEFWVSDNTDAVDRLLIQEGFSYVYAAKAMMCWVTESPNFVNGRKVPLEYRFLSAMTGGLGIGADLSTWTAEERGLATSMIRVYKEIRPLVQNGSQYRLASLRSGQLHAVQYVGADTSDSAVFVFSAWRHYGEDILPLRLQGLDGEANYELNFSHDGSALVVSGRGLMHMGLRIRVKGDLFCSLVRLKRLR